LIELKEFKSKDFSLFNCKENKKGNYFEHSVCIQQENFKMRKFPRKIPVNNLSFEIKSPSENYCLFLYLSKDLPPLFRDLLRSEIKNSVKKNSDIHFKDLINILNDKIIKFKTLTIKSDSFLDYKEFLKLADSYLFYCAYSVNSVISRGDPFEKGYEDINFGRYHKSTEIIEQDLNSELITYYKIAIASNDPFIEFISFYHIMEYFFRKFKEEEELKFVLKKYITLNDLKKELETYEKDYYNHLQTKRVEFADANPIKDENFYETLSERIYKIRNSLVHRKESYKEKKYLPFKKEHINELRREILLMRTIATQIILKNSKNDLKR